MLWRAQYDNHQVDLPKLRQWLGLAGVISFYGVAVLVVHLVARAWL